MRSIEIIFPYNQKEALNVFETDSLSFRLELLSSLQGERGLFFETNFTDPQDPFIVNLYETEEFEDISDPSIYKDEIYKCPSKQSAISFISPNTKTDLIIPCNTSKDYGHFLKFLLKASNKEWENLWREVALLLRSKGRVKIWTHGLQVPWLHIRVYALAQASI